MRKSFVAMIFMFLFLFLLISCNTGSNDAKLDNTETETPDITPQLAAPTVVALPTANDIDMPSDLSSTELDDVEENNDVEESNDNEETDNSEKSYSELYCDTRIEEVIEHYSESYNLDFKLVTKEIEKRLYGAWVALGPIGHNAGRRYYEYDSYGDIYIINQDAWTHILQGEKRPAYYDERDYYDVCRTEHFPKPVFFYCTVPVSDLGSVEDIWFYTYEDIEFEDETAIVVMLNTVYPGGKYNVYGGACYILVDDMLLFGEASSYFLMKRIDDFYEWVSAASHDETNTGQADNQKY